MISQEDKYNIIMAKQEKVFILFQKIMDKSQELNEFPINYKIFI